MKRTSLKRKTPLMQKKIYNLNRTPLRKVSKKRASQLRRYDILRKKYLTEIPICEACKVSKAIEIHHKKGREGELLNRTIYWMSVCRPCHTKIETNRTWAYEKGFLLKDTKEDYGY